MISQKSFLEIAKAVILGLIEQSQITLQQKVVEKFSEILAPTRCLIFKTFFFLNENKPWCEITAGVPFEEHGIGLTEPLSNHPDVEVAVQTQETFIIKNPRENPLTSHFHSTIEDKNINQILYIPVKYISQLRKEKMVKVVIVVDAIKEKKEFQPEEIEFCNGVGELISLILDREGTLIQAMRDLIINRITSLGGFALRLEKLAESCPTDKKCQEYVKIILDEVKKIAQFFPQGWRTGF